MNKILIIMSILVIILIILCISIIVRQCNINKAIKEIDETNQFLYEVINTNIEDINMKLKYIDNCIEIYTNERINM